MAIKDILNTPDYTPEMEQADIDANKVMGVLSYLGILVLIPLLGAKNSKFARFHANQGLVLLLAEIIVSVASGILGSISVIGIVVGILDLAFLALVVFGIYNSATGKAKELPVIGSIKLLK